MTRPRVLYGRIRVPLDDPQWKMDLVKDLVALGQIARLPTVAARRRAWRRIPKARAWTRALEREVRMMIEDIGRLTSMPQR